MPFLGCATAGPTSGDEPHAVIGAAAVAPHTPSDWREVRSEHFTLTTNYGEEAARDLITQLERLRRALIVEAWGNAKVEGDRTQAVIFENHGEFMQVADENLAGITETGPRQRIVSFGRKLEEQAYFAHELTHVISSRFLINQPVWFSEGLASFFETIELDYGGDPGTVELGNINVDKVRYLKRHGRLPIAQVLALDRRHYDPDSPDLYGFYATSWLLVHYLYNTHPDGFRNYQIALARGTPSEVAWKSAFPDIDVAKLDDALTLYLQYGRFVVYHPPLSPEPPHNITVRELSEPEVHALRADLLLNGFARRTRAERLALAKAELAPAVAAAPDDPAVVDAEFEWMKRAAVLPLVRRAVAAHPDSALAWHDLGEALIGDSAAAAERLAAFARAAKLDPGDSEALNSWAWELLEEGRAGEALQPALEAAKANPEPNILDTLARAFAENHRCAEAIPIERRAIESVSPEAGRQLRALVENLSRLESRCDAESKPAH